MVDNSTDSSRQHNAATNSRRRFLGGADGALGVVGVVSVRGWRSVGPRIGGLLRPSGSRAETGDSPPERPTWDEPGSQSESDDGSAGDEE
jgi:hypothetical protein